VLHSRVLDTETRDPEEAIALLADAGWEDAAVDCSDPDSA
jgi:hypothetical protein